MNSLLHRTNLLRPLRQLACWNPCETKGSLPPPQQPGGRRGCHCRTQQGWDQPNQGTRNTGTNWRNVSNARIITTNFKWVRPMPVSCDAPVSREPPKGMPRKPPLLPLSGCWSRSLTCAHTSALAKRLQRSHHPDQFQMGAPHARIM